MTNRDTTMSAARRVRRGVAVAIGAVVLLGACSSDGTGPLEGIEATLPADGGEAAPAPDPEPEVPTEPAPEPEPEPAPEPAPEPEPAPAPEAPADDDGLTTEQWVALILLGLGGFAVIAGLISWASRRSSKQQAQQSANRQSSGEIIGLSRWLVDQGSLDVLRATDLQQLGMAWNSVRPRAIDIENRCQVLAGGADQTPQNDAVRNLGLTVSSLRGALETSVQLREDPNASQMQPLIDDNAQTVSQRRQDVQLALDALSQAMV